MSEKLSVPSCTTCGARHKSVFCNQNEEQLIDTDNHKACDFYKKNEVIFKEGQYSKGLYCVNKGKVKLLKSGAQGKDQIIRFATAGDIMGYHSLLTGTPLSASARAIDEAAVCFIPADQFFKMIKQDHQFSLKLLELSAQNWNNASKLVTDMAQKTSKQRLAEMLLWLEKTFGETQDGHIDIKLSREDLANMVGTATEATIRLLSELKKNDIIELSGKNIRLVNKQDLAKVAALYD